MINSGMLVNGEQLAVVSVSGHTERHDVNSLLCNIEEADQRLIKHIHWSAVNGNQSFIVQSNDSDVLLLLVHYFKAFKMAELKCLRQMLGTGDNKRFVPVNALYK